MSRKTTPMDALPAASLRDFGHYLRGLRKERGLTLEDVADKVNASITYLAKIERGELPPPKSAKITKWAAALDVDIFDLCSMSGGLDPLWDMICGKDRREDYIGLLRETRKWTREETSKLLNWVRVLNKEKPDRRADLLDHFFHQEWRDQKRRRVDPLIDILKDVPRKDRDQDQGESPWFRMKESRRTKQKKDYV